MRVKPYVSLWSVTKYYFKKSWWRWDLFLLFTSPVFIPTLWWLFNTSHRSLPEEMMEMSDFVRVRISFEATPIELARAVKEADALRGLPPGDCKGERLWAVHIKDDVYALRNEPLHPNYRWGDHVRCVVPDGEETPVVVEKVKK
jgi:hypothetical protein